MIGHRVRQEIKAAPVAFSTMRGGLRKLFQGLAIGGPLDGKSISHESPRYKVPEIGEVKPFVSFEAVMMESVTVDVFEYSHLRTPGGDVWIPSAVDKGKRYEHKIYRDPYDYVFSKLIKGYRPEGY